MDALLSEPLLDAAASDDGEGYFDIAPHSRRTTDETPQQDVYPEKVDVTSPFSAFNSGIGAATHGLTEKSSIPARGAGQVYWIRHGESTANERGIFAGVVDAGLTAYGVLQGRRAAADLTKKFGSRGGTFHKVYTSYLRRAILTRDLSLGGNFDTSALITDATESEITPTIAERSFGIFTGENKALLMSLFGYETYENLLHDADLAPMGGESGGAILDRCQRFYQEKVLPETMDGKNVLVVCHSYVLMAMAIYLAGRTRNDFIFFKVPNGKALTTEELVALLGKETDTFDAGLKYLGDMTNIYALRSTVVMFLVGAIVRIAAGNGLPDILFKIVIVFLLGLSTFYTYLDVDLFTASTKTRRSVVAVVCVQYAARWIVGLLVLNVLGDDESEVLRSRWMLYLMIPPALTCPGVARLVGGDMYAAATMSSCLSVVLPILLIIMSAANLLPQSLAAISTLEFFYAIFAIGLVVPVLVSQVLRKRSPVQTAKHTARWKLVTGLCVVLLGFFSGLQCSPKDLFYTIGGWNGASPFDGSDQEKNLAPLTYPLGIYLATRGSGWLTTKALQTVVSTPLTAGQLQDVVLLFNQANFFLWLSLGHPKYTNGSASFFAGLFFFGGMALEQSMAVAALARKLCQASVSGAMMSKEEADGIISSLDPDSTGVLTKTEIMKLVIYTYERSGQKAPNGAALEAMADACLKLLGARGDGTVAVPTLAAYMHTSGATIDFNRMPSGVGAEPLRRMTATAAGSRRATSADDARRYTDLFSRTR